MRAEPFQWVQRELAGQRVWVTPRRGRIPVDIETGFLGRHPTYRSIADLLTRSNGDVSLAERPGFGGLKGIPGRCEIKIHVKLKLERLEARRIELGDPNAKFVLVSHSMGSAISSAFAAEYPDFVASMVDLGGIGDPHPDWSLAEWEWRGLKSLLPVEARPAKFIPYARIAARGYADAVGSIARHPTPALKHAFFCKGLDNSEADEGVGNSGIPVLIVRGGYDFWVPEESLHSRADRMGVPQTFRGNALTGRHTLPNENHLLGNTLPTALRTLIHAHMSAVSRTLSVGQVTDIGRTLSR